MTILATSRKPWPGTHLSLVLFVSLFLLCFNPDALAWDGAFYYATARSLVFDGDLHLANDLVLARAVTPPDFAAAHFERALTQTGHVATPFALGTSLLWLPWFALVMGIVRLVGAPTGALTGFEWYFRWTIAVVTSAYGWLAFLVCHRLVRRLLNASAALTAVCTAMVATPLVYYQFREPFYSHPVSALVVAAAAGAWWRITESGTLSWCSALKVGALIGLAALIRTQNILYLVLPASTACAALIGAVGQRDWHGTTRPLAFISLAASSALLVLSPQFAAWQVIYGQPMLVPQGPRFIHWRAPWLGLVLFSPYHGLLPWMPLALPACVGLILSSRQYPNRSIPLLIALAAQIYLNGCVADWAGGGGYGARRFSDTLFILIVGLTYLLAWDRSRAYRVAGIALCVLLAAQQWLILRYGFLDGLGRSTVTTGQGTAIHASTGAEFLRQLAGYVPLALRQPLATLIFPHSPLARAKTDLASSAIQTATLAGVLALTHVPQLASRRNASPARHHRVPWPLGATLIACGILLFDVWLLLRG